MPVQQVAETPRHRDRHTVTDCDPANYARVHRKPRCPVPGCKEKMTATNTYRCKECCVDVCLKHRFGKDHRCSGKPGAEDTSAF